MTRIDDMLRGLLFIRGYLGARRGRDPASTSERDGAQVVLGRVLGWFTWLRPLRVDGGGETFAQWVKGLHPKLAVTVVKYSDATVGFKVLPHRGS